ncbi:Methyltransferase domain-containing protein [Cohnella sp. OV330]|uniref:class I SAM-dependent methyltransferase n=1 Tax=Cohnella sp. OV330 TaxID=1855288 RepID=UPI0008F06078|nr:class I SAM-dependent methyltransferase [Cohnella sp. OV330]SFB02273.1 Methyltransferase domain-containing protein [Cohnella sp. OV330]
MENKERFTDRVETYVKYRPSYPAAAIDYLYGEAGLRRDSQVTDIGAGTGIFSRLLLERGTPVTAVEPNRAMREEAERSLEGYPGFKAVNGAAEQTGLPDASADFIVSAQAFHWFDQAAAKREFHRLLRPAGKAALIWNTRLTSGTPFLEAYEALLLRLGTDYATVNHRNITPEQLAAFFEPGTKGEARFPNRQLFDFDGLSGRLRSSSYTPVPGHPNYEPMMRDLRDIFDLYQQDGYVSFDYETEIYWGEV